MKLLGVINLVCFFLNMYFYFLTNDIYCGLIGVVNLMAVGLCLLPKRGSK